MDEKKQPKNSPEVDKAGGNTKKSKKPLTKKQKLTIGISVGVVAVLVILLIVVLVLNSKNNTPEPEKPAVIEEPEVEEEEEGYTGSYSYLTGKKISDKLANKRPLAIMIENTYDANPLYGLNEAGIVYECPVEGGYTRLMALFDKWQKLEKIGCVRSCRPYYVYIASEYNAVYAHFGQSVHGQAVLDTGIVDELNGLGAESSVTFFRTNDHPAPHNAYTSGEYLQAGLDYKGINLDITDASYDGHFRFAGQDEDETPNKLENGEDCAVIVPYYFYDKPWYVYDKKSKQYLRYQFGGEMTDLADDNKQVTCTNIIFQNVDSSIYDGTAYLNIPTTGSGAGKFFTRGKMIDITWHKDSDTAETKYYDGDGNEIVLNQGRTWILFIQNAYADQNQYYVTAEEFPGR